MTPILTDVSQIKLAFASVVLAGGWFADATLNLDGWESAGIKGMLIAAVVYLVRELARQRTDDKAEAKERESKMITAIDKNTTVLGELRDATERQTEYYETVARTIIERDLGRSVPSSPAHPSTP